VENSNLLSKLWLLVPAGRETEISDFLLFFRYKATKTRHRLILEDSAIFFQDCFLNMLNQTSTIELLSIYHYRRI